jgi:hypothetical protein
MVSLVVPRERIRARAYKMAEMPEQVSGQAMRQPAAYIGASAFEPE